MQVLHLDKILKLKRPILWLNISQRHCTSLETKTTKMFTVEATSLWETNNFLPRLAVPQLASPKQTKRRVQGFPEFLKL